MGTAAIILTHGEWQAELRPDLGGGLANLTYAGVPVLRPWNGEQSVRRMASYPLVPYSNRIADAKFEHGGRDISLRLNFGDHPHSLHGLGWQRAWTVTEQGDSHAVLSLQHDASIDGADWPWSFTVTQRFQLNEHGLTVSMTYHNLANETVPVGLGWHPFFPRNEDAKLSFTTDGVWLKDERSLPQTLAAVPTEWDYQQMRAVGQPYLDHCFAGWNRQAQIHWPSQNLTVNMTASEALSHLVVFTPEEMDFFAVEPVSHANNAFNMATPTEHGLRNVDANERYQVTMSFSIERNLP